MSEQLQKDLNTAKTELVQAKNTVTQINARLAATDQFTNTVLKDLLDTKTNLNLYMQAHNEALQEKAKLEAEIAKLKNEKQKLTDELAKLDETKVEADAA